MLTRPDHPSGSDRIFEALATLDPDRRHDVVVNVQGDFPTISSAAISAVLAPLDDAEVAIGTLAGEIVDEHERNNPNVVKVVGTPVATEPAPRALLHPRHGSGGGGAALPSQRHLRLSPRRARALRHAAPSPLEKREKLEQLRALEAGMRIDVMLIDEVPFGVDTPSDLERARKSTVAESYIPSQRGSASVMIGKATSSVTRTISEREERHDALEGLAASARRARASG